jgi:hypothetical protein
MELIEHVPGSGSWSPRAPPSPGGNVFFSTINRNPKAYLFAVVEYVLGLLPKGTHDYQRFRSPPSSLPGAAPAARAPRSDRHDLQPGSASYSLATAMRTTCCACVVPSRAVLRSDGTLADTRRPARRSTICAATA